MAALQPVACFFFSACIAAQTTRGIPKNMEKSGKTLGDVDVFLGQ